MSALAVAGKRMKTIKRKKRIRTDRRNMRSTNRRWSLPRLYIRMLFNSHLSNNLLFSSRWFNSSSNQSWQVSLSLWWDSHSQWWANLSQWWCNSLIQWWCKLKQISSLWISTGMDLSMGMRQLLKDKTTSYSLLKCIHSLWSKVSQWFRHSRFKEQNSPHTRLLNQECAGIQIQKCMFDLSIKGLKQASDM